MKIAGRIYSGSLAKGVIEIENGVITKIGKSGKADVDVGNAIVVPAATDLHVHFRDPGQTHKEDWESGSKAAARGGVTAVVDMPNTVPATTSLKTVRDKLRIAAKSSVVDYGVWAGASWYTGELDAMLKWAIGVKAYLGATTGDLLLEDPGALKETIAKCGAAEKPMIVHAEAQRILAANRRTEHQLLDHHQARPALAEVEAIYDLMKILPGIKTPARIHIAHTASAEAIHAAQAARFSTGVCPHHLLLDTDAKLDPAAWGKMNPPLREAKHRKALWAAYHDGAIGILESDHAPHTKTEKGEPFHNAPAGIPGVDTMVPLMMAKVAAGELELSRVVETTSTHPAAYLGLRDRGTIAVGQRAHLAVYDLDNVGTVEKSYSKVGWTPFAGHKAVYPSHVWRAGNALILDGEAVDGGLGESLVALPEEP